MMKINEINYCNIDKVLKVISSGKNNQNYKKQKALHMPADISLHPYKMPLNFLQVNMFYITLFTPLQFLSGLSFL